MHKRFIRMFIPPVMIIIKNKIFARKSLLQRYILELFSQQFPTKSGYYIELGANDVITQSNTIYLEKKGWKGTLIEPSLNKFLECSKNRDIRNNFYCNACVSFDYKEKYVEMSYSNLMTISPSISSKMNNISAFLETSKEHLMPHEKIVNYGAKARTLNEILIDSNAPKLIDFFSLDVEGSEIEVLNGIDFDQFKFRFILVETDYPEVLKNML